MIIRASCTRSPMPWATTPSLTKPCMTIILRPSTFVSVLALYSYLHAVSVLRLGTSCSTAYFVSTWYECSSHAVLLIALVVAVYTATLSHAFLYHRREIAHGFKSIFSGRKTSDVHTDVHVRLMMSYKVRSLLLPFLVFFSHTIVHEGSPRVAVLTVRRPAVTIRFLSLT
jgi:hypothetical protein